LLLSATALTALTARSAMCSLLAVTALLIMAVVAMFLSDASSPMPVGIDSERRISNAFSPASR